ncbi:uncharacterized protein LOC125266872 isoform X2 [Megalobrama amblycephala]|uniref:uncharacterized protein LOC125266872 isoform X2 n=2 Tax=Megalobrama amblycephala TaxID=75352 RepID=UPI0020140267|nr:uncharacterized protein LOC125266872 isoform X2 [Megalobrama amblycephala]
MLGRGTMRVFGETLLIITCLHLCQGSGQSGTCKPDNCFICWNNTISNNCSNGVPENCTKKDLNVTTEPASPVDEGLDVTVTCTHDLPNGSISWLKNDELQEGENKKTFQIEIILKDTNISCKVKSACGDLNSTITIKVKAANNMMIIMICVGGAAALLMLFAVGMKIVLRRGQVQSQARKRQRQQNMENIHSTVNTVTSYY